MKLITWNVNSVRSRLERLLALLDRHQPDVVCLQELKVQEESFPSEAINATGYESAVFGQKTYNGVAILSRIGLDDIRKGIDDSTDDNQSRLISAEIDGVRIVNGYFPNGKAPGTEQFEYKIAWIGRLRKLLERDFAADQPLIVCGDTNVAIDDKDVAKPEKWAETVHCVPVAREAFTNLIDWGLRDVFREANPEGGIYSWWDYRQLAFPKGDGLRIDHILATDPIANKCSSTEIDRDERKGKKPSDHAPVIAEFSL